MNKEDSLPLRSSWKQVHAVQGGSPVTEESPVTKGTWTRTAWQGFHCMKVQLAFLLIAIFSSIECSVDTEKSAKGWTHSSN